MNSLTLKIITLINSWSGKKLRQHHGLNADVNQQIRRRRKKVNGFQVTDHALIRYFERMEGYDIKEVMKIISRNVKTKDGINKYINGDMTVVTEGNTVLTVYKHENHLGNTIKGLDKL